MKTINTRRSIRKYSDRNVSDELLNRLLSEAMRTQTMGNLQFYSVVVTRDSEMKQRLAPAHFNQPMVTSAPVVLTECSYRRFALLPDFLQSCRRGRTRSLLSWHHRLYASDDYRHA